MRCAYQAASDESKIAENRTEYIYLFLQFYSDCTNDASWEPRSDWKLMSSIITVTEEINKYLNIQFSLWANRCDSPLWGNRTTY